MSLTKLLFTLKLKLAIILAESDEFVLLSFTQQLPFINYVLSQINVNSKK